MSFDIRSLLNRYLASSSAQAMNWPAPDTDPKNVGLYPPAPAPMSATQKAEFLQQMARRKPMPDSAFEEPQLIRAARSVARNYGQDQAQLGFGAPQQEPQTSGLREKLHDFFTGMASGGGDIATSLANGALALSAANKNRQGLARNAAIIKHYGVDNDEDAMAIAQNPQLFNAFMTEKMRERGQIAAHNRDQETMKTHFDYLKSRGLSDAQAQIIASNDKLMQDFMEKELQLGNATSHGGRSIDNRGIDLGNGKFQSGDYIITYDADGMPTYQPIRGSKPYMEQEKLQTQAKEKANADLARIDSSLDKFNDLAKHTEDALKIMQEHPELTTGAIGTATAYLPFNSPRKNLEAIIDEIKSKIVLDTIASLKELSKTGATGFGNLSNQEAKYLENSLGSLSLSQKPKQLMDRLKDILIKAQAMKNRLAKSKERLKRENPSLAADYGLEDDSSKNDQIAIAGGDGVPPANGAPPVNGAMGGNGMPPVNGAMGGNGMPPANGGDSHDQAATGGVSAQDGQAVQQKIAYINNAVQNKVAEIQQTPITQEERQQNAHLSDEQIVGQKVKQTIGMGEALMRGVAQGLSFGFSDELKGAAAAGDLIPYLPEYPLYGDYDFSLKGAGHALADLIGTHYNFAVAKPSNTLIGAGNAMIGAGKLAFGAEGAKENYIKTRDEEREKDSQAMLENPYTYRVGDIGGSIVPALLVPEGVVARGVGGLAKGVGAAGRAVSATRVGKVMGVGLEKLTPKGAQEVASLVETLSPAAKQFVTAGGRLGAKSAKIASRAMDGAAFGALGNIGNSSGEDMLGNSVQGAVIGGTANVVLPYVGRGIGAILKKFSPSDKGALNRIVTLIKNDPLRQRKYGVNAPSVSQELAHAPQGTTLLDLSSDLQDTARAITGRRGQASGVISTALGEREKGAFDRLHQALDSTFGEKANIVERAKDIKAQRQATTAPLYEQALSKALPPEYQGALRTLYEKPAFEKAFNEGATWYKNEFGGSIDEKATIRILHYAKQTLDDKIAREPSSNESRILMGIRDQVTDLIGKIAPEYETARELYATSMGREEALSSAREFMAGGTSVDAAKAKLDGMTPEERRELGLSVRSYIDDIMKKSKTGDTAALNNFLKAQGNVDKLSMLFPETSAFKSFVAKEIGFSRNADNAIAKAPTNESKAVMKLVNAISSFAENSALALSDNNLAKFLVSMDRDQLIPLLQEVERGGFGKLSKQQVEQLQRMINLTLAMKGGQAVSD